LGWSERGRWQRSRFVAATVLSWAQMKKGSWLETLRFLLKLIPKKATLSSSSLRGFFFFFSFCF
jgi:hypothetical protein